MNLPNRISLLRLVLIPIIVLLWELPYTQLGIAMPTIVVGMLTISMKNLLVLILFVIASITDFFDGHIARSRNQVTSFGSFIDPIADKCLTTTLFILFAAQRIIPAVPVLIMIWRDIVVDGIRMVASNNGKVVSAGGLGKLKTVAQMIAIILILLDNFPFAMIDLPVATFMLWFAMCVSVASGVYYFKQSRDEIIKTK